MQHVRLIALFVIPAVIILISLILPKFNNNNNNNSTQSSSSTIRSSSTFKKYRKVAELSTRNSFPHGFTHINKEIESYIRNEIPVVIRNDDDSRQVHLFNWTALNNDTHWSRDQLLKRFGNENLFAIHRHSHRLFMYYNEDRAMSDFIPRRSNEDFESNLDDEHAMLYARIIEQDISFSDFIKMYESSYAGKEPFTYYSQPLKNDRFLNDVQPLDILQVTNTGKSVNMWIGGKRSTAQAHYDAFHNAFVQIVGSKTFTLYPPDQWLYMYLHSRHHPSYRQSQLNFQEDNWKHLHMKYPLSHYLVKPYQVTLNEGDFLYLPPYWFHHVEASQDLSVSVNVWTDCNEGNLYEELIGAPLPFESDWSSEKTLEAGRLYMTIFINKLLKDQPSTIPLLKHAQTVKEYIQYVIIHSRYYYLFQDNVVPSKMACEFKDVELTALELRKFEPYAAKVVEVAMKMKPQVRDNLVGNYLEDLALFVVGDVKKVGAFFQSCF
jgi:hypothetical protein